MSQYDVPYEYDSWVSGTLELSIETLAGTAFEIRVLPTDTIMSIKSKIQRVEGIPVSQQHLLYNLEELDNSASVRDYAIQNGATLRLVLSMRGGPISTRRLPPVDEVAWRELHELMVDGRKEELLERLPSGSRVTVLVFREGDQVNLFRVVENEDGTYSPLSESWSGTSIRNLFTEEDPEESAKRLKENSVTMGKMQDLKEKLESLSIQKRERKIDHQEETDETRTETKQRNTNKPQSIPAEGRPRVEEAAVPSWHPKEELGGGRDAEQPCGEVGVSRNIRPTSRPEVSDSEEEAVRPRRHLVSCTTAHIAGLTKARKEAENLIRMQSKTLNVLVDSDQLNPFSTKRAPLPEIRRSPVGAEKERHPTTSRLPASSFAILEAENEGSHAPSMCSSRASLVALPSNHQVAIAFSSHPRERVSTSIGRSQYRVSRLVLDRKRRPKTSPSKVTSERTELKMLGSDQQPPEAGSRSKHMTTSTVIEDTSTIQVELADQACSLSHSQHPRQQVQGSLSNAESLPTPLLVPQKPAASLTKRKLRCLKCNRRLNITNKHTCRCGNIFCSSHRYSEVHNCPFDYKEEGRKLLWQTNLLVAAPKLPKI